MCRNIKTLFNFDPPVTDPEVRAAALQYVRKISGFTKPSKANEAAFQSAVDDIARVSEWITGLLLEAEARNSSSGDKIAFCKLSREEYANTIRDLLGVTFSCHAMEVACGQCGGCLKHIETIQYSAEFDFEKLGWNEACRLAWEDAVGRVGE